MRLHWRTICEVALFARRPPIETYVVLATTQSKQSCNDSNLKQSKTIADCVAEIDSSVVAVGK